jgi:WD40 repeat protein
LQQRSNGATRFSLASSLQHQSTALAEGFILHSAANFQQVNHPPVPSQTVSVPRTHVLQIFNRFIRRMAIALLALEIRPDPVCTSSPTGHTLPLTAISFNANGSLAATCSHDSLIQLWRVQCDGLAYCLATLTAHSNPVCDVAFSPCGRFLASCSMNAMIILWTLTSDSSCICKTKLQHHSEAVFCISFSPKTALIAAGSGDNRISLMRYEHDGSMHLIHELLGHSSWVLSLAFHPSARQLCSGSKDTNIR